MASKGLSFDIKDNNLLPLGAREWGTSQKSYWLNGIRQCSELVALFDSISKATPIDLSLPSHRSLVPQELFILKMHPNRIFRQTIINSLNAEYSQPKRSLW